MSEEFPNIDVSRAARQIVADDKAGNRSDFLFEESHHNGSRQESIQGADVSSVDTRQKLLESTLNGDLERPLPHIVLLRQSLYRLAVDIEEAAGQPRTGAPKVDTSIFEIQSTNQRKLGYAIIKS